MIIHAHTVFRTSASSVLLRPWFVVLVLAGAVERLTGVALGVAVERDWVVLVLAFHAFVVPCISSDDYSFYLKVECVLSLCSRVDS